MGKFFVAGVFLILVMCATAEAHHVCVLNDQSVATCFFFFPIGQPPAVVAPSAVDIAPTSVTVAPSAVNTAVWPLQSSVGSAQSSLFSPQFRVFNPQFPLFGLQSTVIININVQPSAPAPAPPPPPRHVSNGPPAIAGVRTR